MVAGGTPDVAYNVHVVVAGIAAGVREGEDGYDGVVVDDVQREDPFLKDQVVAQINHFQYRIEAFPSVYSRLKNQR